MASSTQPMVELSSLCHETVCFTVASTSRSLSSGLTFQTEACQTPGLGTMSGP